MGWKGESRRHSLSRKGIKTNINRNQRLAVNNFVARGSQTPEEREEYIRREIRDFQSGYCPYGYLDIQQAILHLDDYGKNSTDLQEMLDEYVEGTGSDRNDVDITAIAYDGILQEIRNEIDSEISFDIMNDAGYYTAGNFMATSYDYSQADQDALIEAIKDADVDSRNNLLSDANVETWLGEVDIDVKQFKEGGK
ncbi:hypothetical protein KAU43_07735 [candidate division WOR-3 bacterium]|nr:hypothetical protein [candidate division WOR-3 bacterium]